MIDGLSVLALITARGGSKRLKRKNLREVAGRSLLARAIDAARAATTVDRVILSTEDPEIIAAAIAAGCEVPFVRPPALATDTADSMAVVHHALAALTDPYDLVVLLQPTSPLRTGADIDGAVGQCLALDAPACVAVTACAKPPHAAFYCNPHARLRPVLPQPRSTGRRQHPAVVVNGAVYVARCQWLREQTDFATADTVAYLMPAERSIDVDTELDLVIANALAQHFAAAVEPRRAEPGRAEPGRAEPGRSLKAG